jgi:predicted metal-dependent phosphoesterase TrpH
MLYDLHSHSTASDGTLTPAELVMRAIEKGVDVLALTDHDTTGGHEEAIQAASGQPIRLITGVEISVTWERQTLHILGLDIDSNNEKLQQGLTGLREFRVWRAQEIARRLEKHQFENALEGAQQFAKGDLISRTHFAHYIVACNRAKNVSEVFKKFLVNNKPGHVSGQWVALETAIEWIKGAGGYAVIAHPARYRMSATKLRRLFEEFKELGGVGIEVVSGSHRPNDCHQMANYARKYEFMASAGSDFHGPENPWIELGRISPLPKNCEPVWQLFK